MLSGTFYGRDVTAIPHSGPAQFTQVVQAAGNSGKKAELVEQTTCLRLETMRENDKEKERLTAGNCKNTRQKQVKKIFIILYHFDKCIM